MSILECDLEFGLDSRNVQGYLTAFLCITPLPANVVHLGLETKLNSKVHVHNMVEENVYTVVHACLWDI